MPFVWLLVLALLCVAVAVIFSLRRNRRAPPSVPASDRPWVVIDSPTPTALPADAQIRILTENLEALQKLAFGADTLQLHSLQEHEGVIAAADAMLADTSGELRHMPRRPMLLPQLLRVVNDTEGSRKEISNIIGQDPALAGSLLKLANSPLYRVTPQPVESIDRAIAVLGTDGIRSLISAAILQPVFRVSGEVFREFPEVIWKHTFLAGGAAETFAGATEEDPFTAQLLAMLMGLSAIIVFRATLDCYKAPQSPPPDANVIAALIDKHCVSVSLRVAQSWGLSERMFVVLEEQESKWALHELSQLGQHLRLGRLAGALAVLRQENLMTDEQAREVLAHSGASLRQIERVWGRLGRESLAA